MANLKYFKNEISVKVSLPEYVDKFATNFTVHVTPIYNGNVRILNSSKVINGQFEVYGESGSFSWIVYAKRGELKVEPEKSKAQIKGEGPYKWIQ